MLVFFSLFDEKKHIVEKIQFYVIGKDVKMHLLFIIIINEECYMCNSSFICYSFKFQFNYSIKKFINFKLI